MFALYDENHLHKKPAAFVGTTDPALAWTTGQAPIDHPGHRSGAPKTTRSETRSIHGIRARFTGARVCRLLGHQLNH